MFFCRTLYMFVSNLQMLSTLCYFYYKICNMNQSISRGLKLSTTLLLLHYRRQSVFNLHKDRQYKENGDMSYNYALILRRYN